MKDIMLKIVGKQIDEELEEDQIEFITEGKLYERGNSIYLVYEETELSGIPGCKTSLKLTGNKIKMKRIGDNDNTAIEFQKGRRYNGYYDTPYGTLEMEVLTNSVENNITAEGKGNVYIDYNISLKGIAENRNRLNIEVM